MSEKFRGRYELGDGYAGGSRPHYFTIRANDLPDEATEMELQSLFEEEMQSDFEQHIMPEPRNCDEFVAWALDQIKQREAAP